MTDFPRTARAPGKLVMLGEYAVVDGAPAVVAGIDRYAVASARPVGLPTWGLAATNLDHMVPRFVPARDPVPPGPLSLARTLLDVLAEAGALADMRPLDITLNSAALFAAEGKLGLGSSTAVLAALHGLLVPDAPPALAFARIDETHRRAQHGLGSGVDVAAAVTGGVVIYARGTPPSIEPVSLPDNVHWQAVYTGVSVSTAHYLGRVARWRAENPGAYAARRDELTELAHGGAAALCSGDGAAFCEHAGQYGAALGRFGRACGLDIESMEHTALADVAARNGVFYKVSGAGGGDIGLAFSTSPERLAAFSTRVPAVDPRFRVLSLAAAPALWK